MDLSTLPFAKTKSLASLYFTTESTSNDNQKETFLLDLHATRSVHPPKNRSHSYFLHNSHPNFQLAFPTDAPLLSMHQLSIPSPVSKVFLMPKPQ